MYPDRFIQNAFHKNDNNDLYIYIHERMYIYSYIYIRAFVLQK